MRRIQLTQGKYAQVDDRDYGFLSGFKWCAAKRGNSYYAETTKLGLMHRFLLGLKKPRIFCDHKDGNGLNNQRDNLRVCTNQQNSRNKKSSKSGTSKYLGVGWDSSREKWMAQILVNGKSKKLGRFKTELEAAIIYNIAARKYYGEFANPNTF